ERRYHMCVPALSERVGNRYAGSLAQRLVGRYAEILEKLSLEDIPAPVKPCLAQLRRQCLKLSDIVGLRLHQRAVVGDQRLDENVVISILAVLIPPVDKQTLDVAVRRTARVHRVVDPLGESIYAAHTRGDFAYPHLLQLRRLVKKNDVILRALILV